MTQVLRGNEIGPLLLGPNSFRRKHANSLGALEQAYRRSAGKDESGAKDYSAAAALTGV
jgi:hypothetical protein